MSRDHTGGFMARDRACQLRALAPLPPMTPKDLILKARQVVFKNLKEVGRIVKAAFDAFGLHDRSLSLKERVRLGQLANQCSDQHAVEHVADEGLAEHGDLSFGQGVGPSAKQASDPESSRVNKRGRRS